MGTGDLEDFQSDNAESFCDLERLPSYYSIGLYGNHLIVDPSSEEESLMDGIACIAVDSQGCLSGRYCNSHTSLSKYLGSRSPVFSSKTLIFGSHF